MRRVLFICVQFPPEEGGGTIRMAKMAKYLPAEGWALSVVSARPSKGSEKAVDQPLVRVRRVPRLDVASALVRPIAGLRWMVGLIRGAQKTNTSLQKELGSTEHRPFKRRLAEIFLVPDDRIFWVPFASLAALWTVFRDKPERIYTTSPSPCAHLVGWFVMSLTGLPWIIEFRDPWTFNPFRNPRAFAWMERLEHWLERRVLMQATHIVVTSDQYRSKFLARYSELSQAKFSFIPNGFDPEDFENVEPVPHPGITMVHAGTFYSQRSPLPFLEGLSIALADRPALASTLKVLFVGPEDPLTSQGVNQWKLKDVLVRTGRVSHAMSIRYMVNADMLLLVPGPGEGTVPGKLYEYFGARKPILCLAEDGASRDLILSLAVGVAVPPDKPEVIAMAILAMIDTHLSRGKQPVSGEYDKVIHQFDRRQIAKRTADLLSCSSLGHNRSSPRVSV